MSEDREAKRLATDFKQGNPAALVGLYDRYFDEVYGYLRVALRDHHEAEDVAQEVFLRVLSRIDSYESREGTPFRAWLFRIARNAVLDVRRSQRNRRVHPEEPRELDRRRAAEGASDGRSLADWIGDPALGIFVQRLPDEQREVVVLRYMLDFTVAEIAQLMGKTPNAVSQLHVRAIKTLEERMTALGRRREPAKARRAPVRIRYKPARVIVGRRFSLGGAGRRPARFV